LPSTPAEGRCQQGRLANRPCAVRVIACPPEADAAICRIVLTVPARKIAASPIATLGLLAMTVPFSVIASSPEADAAICLAYCPDGGRDCRVAHRYARAPRNDGAPLMAVEIAASPLRLSRHCLCSLWIRLRRSIHSQTVLVYNNRRRGNTGNVAVRND